MLSLEERAGVRTSVPLTCTQIRVRREGLRSALANISADQSPSLRIHEKVGFQEVAHFHQVGRKFNQWFDAVYLQLIPGANKSP